MTPTATVSDPRSAPAVSRSTPFTIDLGDARERLVSHPLYRMIDSPERLRRFMEAHVFAVWDFQSLLKAMQQRLTCTTLPWLPTPDPEARRLVNEIVLDEESDELPEGGSASHFELYLDGMRQAGADTGPIDRLIAMLRRATPLPQALAACGGHPAAIEFVKRSFAVIESGKTHTIVAAFTYGREDVIPDMFRHLVVQLAEHEPATWGRFRFYLDRHIEHDDEKHAPVCRRIVARLCGTDAVKWAEASATARECIEARIAFWNALAMD
ncbi:DUF3050 domain-containing protein [bacterium]|nr:DUF3050 domain-containing protein [bacterium]